MKKSIFITMLLCLFAVVANAQTQDVGIQGYYVSGHIQHGELKVGSDDPREFTQIGVFPGRAEIHITQPETGTCTFTFDDNNSGCTLQSRYDRYVVLNVNSGVPSGRAAILEVECEGKYLRIDIYPTN